MTQNNMEVKIVDGKEVEVNEDTDIISTTIGSFGKYQYWLLFLVSLSKITTAFQQMGIIFMAPKTSYICPDSNAESCPCENPVYDISVFTNTLITEWNLICGRSWMVGMIQMFSQLGTLIGSVFFGMASDRFGRRYPLIIAITTQLMFGALNSYTTELWAFTFVRFLIGVSSGGVIVISFVLLMEIVGSKHRQIVSLLYHIFFNLGHLIMCAFGYYYRDYSQFQLAISIPIVLLLSYIILIPESPRWLLAANKVEEAVCLLEKIAKINKQPIQDIRLKCFSCNKDEFQRGTVLDLVKTPNLRKHIICMSFMWMVSSYCYYGVSQFIGQLSGNIFGNVAISAAANIIGVLLFVPFLQAARRRTLVIGTNIISSTCLLAIAVMPEGTTRVVVASIGMVSSFASFTVVYLFCTELFPTVVRNAAVGVSSMSARAGSMVAPYVVGLNAQAIWMPPVLFGIMPILASISCYLLPETKHCELMTTLEEGENFVKKENKRNK